ncbi:hypothetical protein ACU8NH_08560 [Rhizobium leguminosarum]|jgi:hypothetical protein|uniref:Uncharacterized protein n=2 Tax=Rhizobium TaxID=379 RepID=A0A7G6RJ29_RHILV|nr:MULTISPECIES: hypothetical protein [Rhizobium]MBX4858907.1 hypothetical protein [Rhizobium bangladeshense]MVO95212.1 hypothetical protein [Rhizobium leguminosarum bv. phaseoli]NNU47397.1 hypothetical protein [Rhizobium changzhiense]OBY07171.1 hypothetical protein BAE36_11045 [Rhizobium leguminosarum bv. trifolii]MBY5904019.1 hypothetical protein [Rhizobium leguminosarum]
MRSPESEKRSIFWAYVVRRKEKALADIDLALLAQQNAEILEELRALRREVAELKEQSGRTLDFERRNDPRRPNSLTQR